MKKLCVFWIGLVIAASAYSAGGGSIELLEMKPDTSNKPSLQNGLRAYMDYCSGCHSLAHARFNRVARDLEIPEDLFMEAIVFDPDARFGDLMEFSMNEKDGKQWFGAAPPDLTMVTRVRGVDWVYTYLRSFYKDDSRPYGVNNVVFKDVGMPHVLLPLQGLCDHKPTLSQDLDVEPLTGNVIYKESCDSYDIEGKLSEREYEQVVYNLVNFLNYMGEPYQDDRKRLGLYVFIFLIILFIPAYLLQRDLHKDIH